jgi:hypothetical protein
MKIVYLRGEHLEHMNALAVQQLDINLESFFKPISYTCLSLYGCKIFSIDSLQVSILLQWLFQQIKCHLTSSTTRRLSFLGGKHLSVLATKMSWKDIRFTSVVEDIEYVIFFMSSIL